MNDTSVSKLVPLSVTDALYPRMQDYELTETGKNFCDRLLETAGIRTRMVFAGMTLQRYLAFDLLVEDFNPGTPTRSTVEELGLYFYLFVPADRTRLHFYPIVEKVWNAYMEILPKESLAILEACVPTRVSLYMRDYYISLRRELLFSMQMPDMEKAVRQMFPQYEFMLRASDGGTHDYYIIFRTETELLHAREHRMIERIMETFAEVCRQNAPHDVFSDSSMTPMVITYDEVIKKKTWVQTMQDNVYFNDWHF